MSLGGQTAGSPVIARHNNGRLEAFVVGLNGFLFRQAQPAPGAQFSGGWTPFPTTFNLFAYSEEVLFDPFTARLATALHPTGPLYIFGRTVRGRLVYAHFLENENRWSDWKSIAAIQDGHPPMGNPAAASAPLRSEAMSVFVRSRDGAVLSKNLSNSLDDWRDPGPNGWTNHGGIVGGEPVVSRKFNDAANTIETSVYVPGLDRNLYWIGERVSRHGPTLESVIPFAGWRALFSGLPNALLAGNPAIASPASSVCWRGANGNLWTLPQRSFGDFGVPSDTGLPAVGDPAMVIAGNNTYTFFRSTAGRLIMLARRGGNPPEEPFTLPMPVPAISDPSVTTTSDGKPHIVVTGADSQIYRFVEAAPRTFSEGI